MNWLNSLFFGTGVPHSIFILTVAIAVGISLSHHLKFKGITLGKQRAVQARIKQSAGNNHGTQL